MLSVRLSLFACFVMALLIQRAAAADFNVTSPAYYYTIGGLAGNNPTLTLIRGETYTFAINTSSIHPFQINSPGETDSTDKFKGSTSILTIWHS